jgi:hypothetical protein
LHGRDVVALCFEQGNNLGPTGAVGKGSVHKYNVFYALRSSLGKNWCCSRQQCSGYQAKQGTLNAKHITYVLENYLLNHSIEAPVDFMLKSVRRVGRATT